MTEGPQHGPGTKAVPVDGLLFMLGASSLLGEERAYCRKAAYCRVCTEADSARLLVMSLTSTRRFLARPEALAF